jgi:predicted RNase H-like nuclease
MITADGYEIELGDDAPPESSGPIVAGVDGCKAGWICARWSGLTPTRIATGLFPTLSDVWNAMQVFGGGPDALTVDIPIGLPATYSTTGRPCDAAARKLLGAKRSSIFPPPTRHMLEAVEYEAVREAGVSLQSWNLFPKIREADGLARPVNQHILREAHPELAYALLNEKAGGAPLPSKKTAEGIAARLALLKNLPGPVFSNIEATFARDRESFRKGHVSADDLLDAYVLVYVAIKLTQGTATIVTGHESGDASVDVDHRGLRMEICA